MIVKPNFSKFRNNELVQLLNDSLAVCKQQNAGQLQLTEQVSDLDTKTMAINVVLGITQGSAMTEKMITIDRRRDGYLIGIRKYADGLTNHFEPATSEAAQTLLDSIDKYGTKLYSLNYQSETSTINSLVNEWTNDSKLAAAVRKLNLTEWAAELKSTNNQFNEAFLSRVDEKATTQNIKFLELRKAATFSFKDLIKNIEARDTLDNKSSYTAIINSFNVLIEKYNHLAAGHTAADEKPKTGTTPVSPKA